MPANKAQLNSISTETLSPSQDAQDSFNKEITAAPDPQVKAKKQYSPRRSFDIAYKVSILAAYDACDSAAQRVALLRKEGLYHSRIIAWRQQQTKGKMSASRSQKKTAKIDHLIRENEHLKKKMAQAEAIIEIQKKVSDLFGTHILSRESNEVIS